MRGAGGVAAALAGTAGTVMLLRSRRPAKHFPSAELQALITALPQSRDMEGSLRLIERAFVAAFSFPLAILLPEGELLQVRHHSPEYTPGSSEMADAQSAFVSGSTAFRYSFNGSQSCYAVPIPSWKGPLGVILFKTNNRIIGNPDWLLIHLFVNQVSLAVLRGTLEDQARRANVLSETDRFQKALLNSVAHNVRTPLASIIGVLGTLQEDAGFLDSRIRGELVDTARTEAERLNRLLGNLLDLSRLESGALQVRSEICDVSDVIGAALQQLGDAAAKREIQVLAANLPLVRLDFVLIAQVLVNVLDNAVKYSPVATPITLEADIAGGALRVRISDEGDGIPEHSLVRVFEKYNRAGRTGETGGIGLGLSISKGLIEAHKGMIWAERRNPHGTVVTFTVPIGSKGEGLWEK